MADRPGDRVANRGAGTDGRGEAAKAYAAGIDRDQRRSWLFPAVNGTWDGIDLARLDPGNPDDRGLLIGAEHPELAAAVERGDDEIELDGQPFSPDTHLVMHEVIAAQLWDDDPPEVWPTVERLVAAGYERHDILHMLASVAAGEFWTISRENGEFDAREYAAALDDLPGSWEADADDDQFDSLLEELEGTTLTHTLTAAEAEAEHVVLGADLAVLVDVLDDEGALRLQGGATAELLPTDTDDERPALVGDPGWLQGVVEGELIGFRIASDHVEVVPRPTPTPERAVLGSAAQIRDVFDRLNEGDGLPVPLLALLVEVSRSGADRLQHTVLPPLGDQLAAAGFEVRDADVAPIGTDWGRRDRVVEVVATGSAHGLDQDGIHALVLVCELFRTFAERPPSDATGTTPLLDRGVPDEVGQLLGESELGRAFADAVQGGPPEDVLRFAETVGTMASRRHRRGPLWVASVAANRLGDHVRAESFLRQVLADDPGFPPAVEDSAQYASDRGDAARAAELLSRVDPDDERAALLAGFGPARRLAGRNDPCPCGSGRKHKHCCLGRAASGPLPERVPWLWLKLVWFLTAGGTADRFLETFQALRAEAPEDQEPVPAELDLAASLALFVDGAIAEFLDRRGELLPDDEHNLVAQWSLIEPSVHEVVSVDPGNGVQLRDVRTGDVADVRERLGSASLTVGDLLYTAVVPDGAANQLVGGVVPVSLQLRDPLLEAFARGAGGAEIAGLLGSVRRPPTLLNMEREPTAHCEARYRIEDPVALAALDSRLDRDDTDRWTESAEIDGQRWIRGTVAREADELVVTANSEIRLARLQATVESAVPGLQPIARDVTPFDLRSARVPSGRAPAEAVDDETAAAALAGFVRQQEERWLTEPVPALRGLTPMEAAADPTGREELVALLHEFDGHRLPPGAATFDTARLRARLGLSEESRT